MILIKINCFYVLTLSLFVLVSCLLKETVKSPGMDKRCFMWDMPVKQYRKVKK